MCLQGYPFHGKHHEEVEVYLKAGIDVWAMQQLFLKYWHTQSRKEGIWGPLLVKAYSSPVVCTSHKWKEVQTSKKIVLHQTKFPFHMEPRSGGSSRLQMYGPLYNRDCRRNPVLLCLALTSLWHYRSNCMNLTSVVPSTKNNNSAAPMGGGLWMAAIPMFLTAAAECLRTWSDSFGNPRRTFFCSNSLDIAS